MIHGSSDSPRLGALEVAGTQLVLLRVEVLLAAFADGVVFEQLVARVDAPGRRKRGGQSGTQREHAGAAVLQALVQDVRGVDEQVGSASSALCRDLVAELGEFPLGGPPGEVRVRLREPAAGQPVQAGGPGEGLGEEQHVGVGLLDLDDEPLPEVRRLGVRVVDPKDLDALRRPSAGRRAGLRRRCPLRSSSKLSG